MIETYIRDVPDFPKPGVVFKDITPLLQSPEGLAKAIDDLAKSNGLDVPDRAGELKVKDVCVRHGQGTASLGLPRYYVLIEGPSKNATDDIIIEFRQGLCEFILPDLIGYGALCEGAERYQRQTGDSKNNGGAGVHDACSFGRLGSSPFVIAIR